MVEQAVAMKDIAMETNRKHGGEGDIRILAEDMKVNGLINPITLMPKGRYEDTETGRLVDYEAEIRVSTPEAQPQGQAIVMSRNAKMVAPYG